MDIDAFRRTYDAINERRCTFEKFIIANHGGCSQAHRFCIAEREGVGCGSDEARQACTELRDLLRAQARFALKTNDRDRVLPHGKALRLQVGGLRGIAAALDDGGVVPAHVPDVRGLLLAALARFGTLENLPFASIMQQIAAVRPRRRRRDSRVD